MILIFLNIYKIKRKQEWNKNIYLDYATNTPVDPEVLEKFNETTLKYFANPNLTHKLGIEVNKKIEETTQNIMEMFKKEAQES